MPDDELPPTEYLVMEVLAARHRLGESCWTFPNSIRPTLRQLEQRRNYLGWKSGVAEGTCIAWLSDTGRKAWGLDKPYPPSDKDRFDQAVQLLADTAHVSFVIVDDPEVVTAVYRRGWRNLVQEGRTDEFTHLIKAYSLVMSVAIDKEPHDPD